MKKIKNSILAALGLVLCNALATQAEAGLVLTLDDGIAPITSISDNGVGDLLAADGQITFAGSVGSNWGLSVTTGLSDSPVGALHLNSVDVSTSTGGSLTITLTDDTFSSPRPVEGFMSVGGLTSGTVEFWGYVNGVEVAHFDASSGDKFGSFAESSWFKGLNTSLPYTLTTVAKITHLGSGTTSFDQQLTVPEPASVALLGLGILLMGISSLRLRSKNTL
jgi:hypothetical protein